MRKLFVTAALLSLVATATLAKDKINKDKYQYVEVSRFDTATGVDFPVDYQVTVMEDLVKQLEKSKKFKQVLRAGEEAPDAGVVLKVTGTITEYKPGNRATRYLVGFGAGSTKIAAQVQFTDGESGSVVLDRKVDGKVLMGVMGGNSAGATNGLAKEVVKVVKDRFF